MRFTGFILSQSCFPFLPFSILISSLMPSCTVLFFSYAFWMTISELQYATPTFLFWLQLMLTSCCSSVLIQRMSVFVFFSSLWNISHSLLLSFQLELSCFQPIHSMLSLILSTNSVLITSIEIVSHILLSLLLKPCSVPHHKVHLTDCWPLFMLSSGFFS